MWIEQWPLTKEKLQVLEQLLLEHLKAQLEPTSHGIPMYLLEKKNSGKMDNLNRFESCELSNPTNGSVTA